MEHHYLHELKTWLFHMGSLQTAFLESTLTWTPTSATKNSIKMKELIIHLFAVLGFPSTKHLPIYSEQDNKVQYEF